MSRSLTRVLAATSTVILVTALAQTPAQADDPITITGHVSSGTTGQTVTDGCVTVFDADAPVEVATGCLDPNGEFSIPVAPGAYKVRIQAAGFPEQWYYERSTWDRASRLDLSTSGILIYPILRAGFANIAGRITDPSGAPVPDAAVSVASTAGGIYRDARTDADGRYLVADLAPGGYTVQIYAYGFGFQYAYGTKDQAEAAIFDLVDGETQTVDDTMLPPGAVQVRMVDSTNHKPVVRGCVSVGVTQGDARSCVSDNGWYTVPGVPAGTYDTDVAPEGTHWPTTTSITVEPGETTRLTVEVERATAFVTTVTEAGTGAPAPYVCVQFGTPNLNPYLASQGCSDDDGRLVIGPLEGTVKAQMFAVHPEDRYGAQWVGANGGSGDQRLATVFTGKNKKATAIPPIVMERPGSISGVARHPDTGAPISGVCAFPFALSSTTALDRQSGPHCSNASGVYTINGLGPYAWPVLYVAPFRTLAWTWSGRTGDRFAATYHPVAAGQTTTADITMQPAGSISGVVRTAAGEPTYGGPIQPRNTRTGDLAGPYTTTGMQGEYQLRNLPTQSVVIEYATLGGPQCWYDRARTAAAATPVAVTAGVARTGVDLVDCV